MPAVTGFTGSGQSPRLSGYLGVDPGASGGLAIVSLTGELLWVDRMPDTERDIWRWIHSASQAYRLHATIEKVGGYIQARPTGGGGEQPGSSMFKFGASYGGLRMALIAANVPFDAVTPQAWQKLLSISPRNHRAGEKGGAFKNRLKARAQELFPDRAITLSTADAILLAEFCRRNRGEGVTNANLGSSLF